MKPDTVQHYEDLLSAGGSIYFDPVELDEIYHYYVETNEMSKVEEVLHLAQQLHPDDFIVQQMDAEYTLNCGNPEEALSKLDAIFSEDHPFQCILRSAALAKLGRNAEALDMAEKALYNENPDDYVSYDLGLGFMNAEQYVTAMHYYQRSLQSHPEDTKSLSGMLYCKLQIHDTDGLEELVDKILQLDPFNFEAWMAKGTLLGEKEQYEGAIDAFEYAYAIAPEEADPMVMKARCLDGLGKRVEAIETLREAAEKAFDEQRSSIHIILAGLLSEEGHKEEAVEACWKSLEGVADDGEALLRAGSTFQDIGALPEAAVLLRAALEKMPDDVNLLMVLTDVLGNISQFEEASRLYARLSELAPSASVYAMWGGTLMSLSKFGEALKRFKQANELDELWQTYVLMAACDVELRHYKKMEEHFRMAYALGPDRSIELMESLCPNTVQQMRDNGFINMLEQEREKWIRQRENELRLLAEKRLSTQTKEEES